MDLPSVLVGAVVGALVSVPITILIEEPLLALCRNLLRGRRKPSREEATGAALSVVHVVQRKKELQRELQALDADIEMVQAVIALADEKKRD